MALEAHSVEDVAAGRFVLPGGVLETEGRVHDVVHVRELTGRDEEIIVDRRSHAVSDRVSRLLARVLVRVEGYDGPIDEAFVDRMLIGDRDYLLLRMRQMTIGDHVLQVVTCPEETCRAKADVDFSIGELEMRRVELRARYEVLLDRPVFHDDPTSNCCVLRLPNGGDQRVIGGWAETNPARANSILFSRIILECGRRSGLSEDEARDLPTWARNRLSCFLQEACPGPDLAIEVACPSCGNPIAYTFDLESFFLPSGK